MCVRRVRLQLVVRSADFQTCATNNHHFNQTPSAKPLAHARGSVAHSKPLDNLTHTLIGIGIARAGFAQKLGRGTTVVLAVSSNLPDIDVACLFGGPLGFLWRRTPTHCLIGAAILVVLATIVFRRYYPNLSLPVVFGLTLLGVAGHIFCDLWNSYGVNLYWPFSWHRASFDWVYIIDLWIWAILIVTWVVARLAKGNTKWIWRIGLVLLAVYIAVCARCHWESLDLVRDTTVSKESFRGNKAINYSAPIFIYPEPLGPQRFRAVIKWPDRYVVYEAHPFAGAFESVNELPIEEHTPLVEAVRRTKPAQRLDNFFSTSVWRESADHQAAIVYGLGFRTKVLNDRDIFVFRITPQGQVSRVRALSSSGN
jgi:membrane-bound metal-dependent hydrolase YbcI (DUF457 family)